MNFKKWIPILIGAVQFTERTSASIRQNNTIKIGEIAPFTGDLAVYGQSMKNSIELAVENYNAQGGILGKKIETIVYDSKGDPIEEMNSFEKLNARKAAVIYNSSQLYSYSLANAFKTDFETKGGKVVAYEGYTNDIKDFNSILSKIKAGNPDLLFIPDYYNTTALILQQAKQLGMDVLFVDGVAWTGWNTVKNGNEIFQGGYYSSAYSKEIPTTENRNFIEAYKKKYKEDPNLLAGLTYDAIIILLEAVKKAGSTESNKLIEALEKTDLQGLTGRITFDNEHNPIKPIYMFRIEDSKDILIQKLFPK